MKITVRFRFPDCSSSSCICRRVCASSAPNGSSIRKSLGCISRHARDADALLHAAGELVGIVVARSRSRPTRSMHALAARSKSPRLLALDARAEGDVVAHRQPGKQRRFLEHHGAVRARAGAARRAVESAAAGRLLEARDDVEQRGLAAARGPEQRDELAVADREVDAGRAPSPDCGRHRSSRTSLKASSRWSSAHVIARSRRPPVQHARLEPAASAGRDRKPSQADRDHVGHAPRPCGRRSRRPTARSPGPTSPRRSRPR